jgi:hypothetical protein
MKSEKSGVGEGETKAKWSRGLLQIKGNKKD